MDYLVPEPQLSQEDFAVRRFCLDMATHFIVHTKDDMNEVLDVARDYYYFMTGTDPVLDEPNEDDAQMGLPLSDENVVYMN